MKNTEYLAGCEVVETILWPWYSLYAKGYERNTCCIPFVLQCSIACSYWISHSINNALVSNATLLRIQLVFIHIQIVKPWRAISQCCSALNLPVLQRKCNIMGLQALAFSKLVQWLNLTKEIIHNSSSQHFVHSFFTCTISKCAIHLS